MTRIVKDPEERKEELIEAAERLFIEKGYEETAVSDIVREINVGQGTFYHYFRSKEDILRAVAEKQVTPLTDEISKIAESDALPPHKLNAMMNSFLRANSSELDLMKLLHKKGNYLLHHREEEILEERVLPLMAEVASKGAAERYFNTECPEEAIVFLLASSLFLSHHFSSDPNGREKMLSALEKITGKVMGVYGYKFHLEI
jgi:AcrR family transcriptional regulator